MGWFYHHFHPFISYGRQSLPVVADLMEICIDDVLRAPVAPPVSSTKETGSSSACPTASVTTDIPPSLTGEAARTTTSSTSSEAAARLKQLELEGSPVLPAPKNNININMVLNNQDDVVKITEKCDLSSTGSSPVVTPLRTPEDLKSNILKAQAEAAVKVQGPFEEHVVLIGDKNCNLQEASARLKGRSGRMGSNSSLSVGARPDISDLELVKPASLVSSAATSAERLAEDLFPSAPKIPAASEDLAPKVKAEEFDLQSTGPLTDNLIDFTDPTPLVPPVQHHKPLITPRWIIPSTTPPGLFTNGLLDVEPPSKVSPAVPAEGGAALASTPPLLAHTRSAIPTSTVGQPPASEDGATPRGLLTTEL